jgi:hypothetical protein
MASRKVQRWPGDSFELRAYAWRGKGEKSELTGKHIRPIVAMDSKGLYHSGVRNWSESANAKASDALYHPMKSHQKEYAIERAEHMCKVEVERHSELKGLWDESRKQQSPAVKYAARKPIQAEKHGWGLKQ